MELPATGTHVCNNGWVVTNDPITYSNVFEAGEGFFLNASDLIDMPGEVKPTQVWIPPTVHTECVTTTVNAIFALIVDLTKEEQTELYTKLHDSFDHCRIYPR